MPAKNSAPANVDAYLAALPSNQRAALARLRKMIADAVPEAVECISYQVPTFKLGGRMLVGFAAASEHCTFHLMSTTVMAKEAAALKGLPLGKGSVKFPSDRVPQASLVKRLVHARIAEVREAGTKPAASAAGRDRRSASTKRRVATRTKGGATRNSRS